MGSAWVPARTPACPGIHGNRLRYSSYQLSKGEQFKPILEGGLPGSLLKKLGVRGPQKAPTKVRVSLRLSREVVDYFRATGDGWQTRMDSELMEMVAKHKAG